MIIVFEAVLRQCPGRTGCEQRDRWLDLAFSGRLLSGFLVCACISFREYAPGCNDGAHVTLSQLMR
jgi:hypothetical protein